MARAETAFTHREVLRMLSGILLCMLLAALDQTVLATALPAIAGDFNSVPHLSWAITAYLLTSTAATLIFGKLSDLYGRRILLETAIGLFLVASLACAVSQTMGELIGARALQGVGGGGLTSMTQAAIADVVSARERGRYQAYITCTFGAASIAGPLIGGLSVQYLTWRWAFWINLPVGLLAYFLCHRGLRRLPVAHARRAIDFLGAALMLPGVTALMLVIAWGGSEMAWSSAPILGLAAAGVAFLAAFALQERRAPDALLPPRLFANQVVRVGILANALVTATMYGIIMLLPVFLQFVVGVTPSASGAMLLPPLTVQIAVSILVGWRLRASGRYALMSRWGFASLALACALFATMSAATPIVVIEAYMLFYGVGVGLCMAPLWVAVQNAAELRDLGAVTGSNGFFRALGGAFGAALLWSVLLAALDRNVAAGGHADYGSALLRGGRAALTALPIEARAIVLPALAHAFAYAFCLAAAIALAGLAVSWRLKEIPLRTTTLRPAERAAAQ
ncbi:MAG TPA: MDR family MFS transporter [Stellaceae bacterium]|nr:MDR family MFS transporter [Stellaceae bacterium]